jgi:hypothetical protein
MPIHTVAETPPVAVLDSGIREPLPALFMGDREEIRREHEWPGSLFYRLSYLLAMAMGAGAVGGVGFGVFSGKLWMVGMAVGLGVGAAVQWRLAKEVQHFSRWGWYGAMVELAGAAAAKAWSMAHGNVVGGAMGLGIDLLWMSYFWENRRQFDVDFDG